LLLKELSNWFRIDHHLSYLAWPNLLGLTCLAACWLGLGPVGLDFRASAGWSGPGWTLVSLVGWGLASSGPVVAPFPVPNGSGSFPGFGGAGPREVPKALVSFPLPLGGGPPLRDLPCTFLWAPWYNIKHGVLPLNQGAGPSPLPGWTLPRGFSLEKALYFMGRVNFRSLLEEEKKTRREFPGWPRFCGVPHCCPLFFRRGNLGELARAASQIVLSA